MTQNSKDITLKGKKRAKVYSNGPTTVNILEIGRLINYKVREPTYGEMNENI